MGPEVRRGILQSGTAVVVVLAAVALLGCYQRTQGNYWAARANGDFTFMFWGSAALVGSLDLALFALVTSPSFERLGWLLPIKGRWARYPIYVLILLLTLLVPLILLAQPIA